MQVSPGALLVLDPGLDVLDGVGRLRGQRDQGITSWDPPPFESKSQQTKGGSSDVIWGQERAAGAKI